MTRKKFIKALSLAWSFPIIVLFYLGFHLAYFNGGTVTIAINHFGEAFAEFLILNLLVVPVVVVGYIYIFEDVMRASPE